MIGDPSNGFGQVTFLSKKQREELKKKQEDEKKKTARDKVDEIRRKRRLAEKAADETKYADYDGNNSWSRDRDYLEKRQKQQQEEEEEQSQKKSETLFLIASIF
jgi:hypothetical protein